MDQRRPPEYTLEVFADPACVKDIIKGILHTIFFHRYFTPISPLTRDLLDTTLPAIDDVDLETLIEARASALVRSLESPSTTAAPTTTTNNTNNRSASPAVNAGGGGGGAAAAAPAMAKSSSPASTSPAAHLAYGQHHHHHQRQLGYGVGVAPLGGPQRGSTGAGGRGQLCVQFFEKRRRKSYFSFGKGEDEVCWESWTIDVTLANPRTDADRVKVRRAMEKSLQKCALKILNIVNRDKDHIPPITTPDSNPFPYHILVNPRTEGWGQRIGIF
ncbi:autophagy-related protein [Lineolata rhizophorae]|uniref:Autophagy-related protein 101 n=1 Tax=Lineolata rhizophorae TaxID=578093 RepID=A0A6A6P013_9PEZI|nr:autophagy-related protein [Lineolata rhizophorae]